VRAAQQQLAALQLPPVPGAAPPHRPAARDPAGEVRRLAAYLAAAGGSTLAAQLPAVAGAPGMTVERLVAAALAELFKGRLAAAEARQGGALAAPCVLDAPAEALAPAVPRRAGPETPVPAGALAGAPAAAAAAAAAAAPFSYKAALMAKGGGAEGGRGVQALGRQGQWPGPEPLGDRQLAALRDARLEHGSSAGESSAGVAAGLAGLEAGVEHLQQLLAGMAALADRLPAA
jgi:hypothetical protein